MFRYRLEYVIPGYRPIAISYSSSEPLTAGAEVDADGVRLLVERVVRHKVSGEQRVICRRIG